MKLKDILNEIKLKDFMGNWSSSWSDPKTRIVGLEKFGKKHPSKPYIIYIPEAGRGVLIGKERFWFCHELENGNFTMEGAMPRGTGDMTKRLDALANKLNVEVHEYY